MIAPPCVRLLAAAVLATLAPFLLVLPASAHGFTSTVYAELTQPTDGVLSTELEMEYVLLVRSVAKAEGDPELESQAKAAFPTSGADIGLIGEHRDAVLGYLGDRFRISVDGQACTPTVGDELRATERDGVPHIVVTLDHACPQVSSDAVYEIASELFPESEGFVGSTETILDYSLPEAAGNTVLTVEDPSFSTDEATPTRLLDFFVLGAEHLLFGIDHILFLVALIVGSRRPRDILLTATAFTAAHSVTFILASLSLVTIPASIVEPVIALSIAAVAAWHVWRSWRDNGDDVAGSRDRPADNGDVPVVSTGPVGGATTVVAPTRLSTEVEPRSPGLLRSLDSGERVRLAVVFGFGLIHGLGFAGAFGIDEPFSWGLLGSLLVFNLGIEVVQLVIIALVFPVLLVLRHRQPAVGRWLGIVAAAGVALVGLFWFVQRLLGFG
ncbi:HupE/UreJ family protein [Nocardioides panzhihuensis]|uniref:Hydrogenase/urease accessory protein HupE n=1 Tax=Nocardioides panzhihuensis TaxID=860243 RepID=A0A7Z0IQ35_9ACTN|nr:HupE/UreJ family protein [Nocardioides panzhihuensis]NYI75411.1 hydrogenase/urease accessory protein HupE [Nocardioides panzhihuensis]